MDPPPRRQQRRVRGDGGETGPSPAAEEDKRRPEEERNGWVLLPAERSAQNLPSSLGQPTAQAAAEPPVLDQAAWRQLRDLEHREIT